MRCDRALAVGLVLVGAPLTSLGAVVPTSWFVPLPIPNLQALVGASLCFQTIHIDAGGLASSNGIRMTVMQ